MHTLEIILWLLYVIRMIYVARHIISILGVYASYHSTYHITAVLIYQATDHVTAVRIHIKPIAFMGLHYLHDPSLYRCVG